MPDQTYRKKLIEVDLPLDAINKEASREKSIRHGHPSTLHLWWARRPLAACRAVIFASMVDDPSSCEDEYPTEEAQRKKRKELHDLIEEFVKWENSNNESLLAKARKEIAISVARSRGETAPDAPDDVLRYLRDKAPTIYDPFCGGGSIPLEVQRLGLKAVGSDLNPIAVLITKALIELPPKFANRPPINPDADPLGITKRRGKNKQHVPWRGAAGLADDIRYYGKCMREEAFKRIGHLYPQAILSDGSKATVIAWLWARTIPCPNPVCGMNMPLIKNYPLSKKLNNQHWTRPIIDHDAKSIRFEVQDHSGGVPKEASVNRNGATCIACGNTVKLDYVREKAKTTGFNKNMIAIVAEGNRKRLFLSPTDEHVKIAAESEPQWRPIGNLPEKALGFRVQRYGFTEWHQLFTDRQLLVLTTFSELLADVRNQISLTAGDEDYADAICTYLAFAVGRLANSCSGFNLWQNLGDFVAQVFTRQAISMIWDFAETNPFSTQTQNWLAQIDWVSKVVERLPSNVNDAEVRQADASSRSYFDTEGPVIATDPPYYDNIGYADLSDFFYVWLRPLLRDIYPDLFAGMLTPKSEEMIAGPRFDNPRQRFEDSLLKTLKMIRERCNNEFPSSIVYGYKQQENESGGHASTGWETMLNSIVSADFQIVGTWPMRTERIGRPRQIGSNALASSVILVCRPRPVDAATCTRRQFLGELKEELPKSLDQLTREGHIAPTDLAQAAIGPGMEIYSKYSRVSTISGELVSVREALQAINRVIAEHDEKQSGEFDEESQFCLAWMKECQFEPGKFGVAEVLSQAKNIDIISLANHHRLLTARDGEVQLASIDDFHPDRQDPTAPMTAWEGCMRIAYNLDGTREDAGAITGSAEVAHQMGSNADSVERLARVLYNYFDGRGEAGTALLFNELVTSWSEIQAKANEIVTARQTSF